MKKLILYIGLTILLSCADNSKGDQLAITRNLTTTEKEWDFNPRLQEKTKYGLEKLQLKSIKELNRNLIRIWRFPGGGMEFEEMYEFDLDANELLLYAYLLEIAEKHKERDFSYLKNKRIIEDDNIKDQIRSVFLEKELINAKNTDEYCDPIRFGCGDSFLVEYKADDFFNRFVINRHIEDCFSDKDNNLLIFFDLIKSLVKLYSH